MFWLALTLYSIDLGKREKEERKVWESLQNLGHVRNRRYCKQNYKDKDVSQEFGDITSPEGFATISIHINPNIDLGIVQKRERGTTKA